MFSSGPDPLIATKNILLNILPQNVTELIVAALIFFALRLLYPQANLKILFYKATHLLFDEFNLGSIQD